MRGLQTGKVLLFACLFLIACSPVASAVSVVDAMPSTTATLPPPTQTPEPAPPTATPFQALEPTPVPPFPLTQPGCCGHPRWGVDSNWVLFLDRPRIDAQPGLYGVPVNGGEPRLIHPRVGIYSRDFALVAYQDQGHTFVERWADSTRWTIPSLGRPVNFSPSGQRLAWDISSQGINHPDLRQHSIWISEQDGSDAREVITVHGGGFVGWVANEEQFIVSGRLAPYSTGGIWRVDVATGGATLLMELERPREILLSPQGGWAAFTIAFEQEEGRNGLWILNTSTAQASRLEAYGSYRWRDEDALLLIPYDAEAQLAIWQYEASSGLGAQLTDPGYVTFAIANNDWEVSPDGSRIVFVSADDYALWILQLPSLEP